MYRTVDEVFASYPRRFNRNKAHGLSSVIHFDFSEDGLRQWTLVVTEEHAVVREGLAGDAEIVITCRGRDWVDLSNDRLTGVGLMMAGQLTIAGPLRKAVKIQNLFEPEGKTSGADD